MKFRSILCAAGVLAVALLMGGCGGGIYVQPTRVVAVAPAYQPSPAPSMAVAEVDEEFDYVGETTPITVVRYPGVYFYPRYIVECDCIYNVGYVNGIWINHYGTPVVYRGSWSRPPTHIQRAYVTHYRASSHEFQRAPRGERSLGVSPGGHVPARSAGTVPSGTLKPAAAEGNTPAAKKLEGRKNALGDPTAQQGPTADAKRKDKAAAADPNKPGAKVAGRGDPNAPSPKVKAQAAGGGQQPVNSLKPAQQKVAPPQAPNRSAVAQPPAAKPPPQGHQEKKCPNNEPKCK